MDESAWQLYRSAGTVLIAPADVSKTAVQDILDSILLAQLAATRQHDPFQALVPWRKLWIRTLEVLHWAATASTAHQELQSHTCTMASLVAETLGAPPGPDLAGVFTSLKTAQRDALARYCKRDNAEGAQLMLTVCIVHDAELMQLVSVVLDADAPVGLDWLSRQYAVTAKAGALLTKSSYTFALTQDYAPQRGKVIERLGNNRSREIEKIRLCPTS